MGIYSVNISTFQRDELANGYNSLQKPYGNFSRTRNHHNSGYCLLCLQHEVIQPDITFITTFLLVFLKSRIRLLKHVLKNLLIRWKNYHINFSLGVETRSRNVPEGVADPSHDWHWLSPIFLWKLFSYKPMPDYWHNRQTKISGNLVNWSKVTYLTV